MVDATAEEGALVVVAVVVPDAVDVFVVAVDGVLFFVTVVAASGDF